MLVSTTVEKEACVMVTLRVLLWDATTVEISVSTMALRLANMMGRKMVLK